jgi:transmembrane sensor
MQFERLSIDAIDNALAWQNGTIVFQGDPLVDALGEVSRYSDARFELTDETIGEMKIAGVFQIRDLNGFVDSLRANLGIGTRRLSDGTLSLYLIPTEARDTSSN